MEILTDFVTWLQQTLGATAFDGMRLGLIIGPLAGLIIWPFFGEGADRIISWGAAGLLGGAFLGGMLRVTTLLTGVRLSIAIFDPQPGSGTAAFYEFAYAIGFGALIGVLLVVLILELQRAAMGAFLGIPTGVVLGIATVFAWDYLPGGIPMILQPVVIGLFIVTAIVVLAVSVGDVM
jgi:hypothetical protein